MEDNDLKLIYVKQIGKDNAENYIYEFYFSDEPDDVWVESWNVLSPSACGDLTPLEGDGVVLIKQLICEYEFFCAQQNSCFSMQDCKDGCIASAFSYYNDYEAPIVFNYGETLTSISEKLKNKLEIDFV